MDSAIPAAPRSNPLGVALSDRLGATRIPGLLSIAVLLAAACGGEPVPSSTVERDSAGIAIIENTVDTASLRAGWAIESPPSLTIGGLSAPDEQQFFEVSGARRLADGRIAVVDGGSALVRIYGADGAMLRTPGTKGEGPGEFMDPSLAGIVGEDSLIVYDSQLRRVSIVHAEDGFIRSYAVGTEGGGYPIAIGTAADGGLAIGGGMFFSSESGFPSGLTRANSHYMMMAPDGSVRGDLGELDAADMFGRQVEGGFSITTVPFGRSTVTAAASDGVWLGDGDSWEIREYSLDATLRRILRFDRALRPITGALRNAYLAERLEDAEDEEEARSIRSDFEEVPSPDRVPPYQTLAVDALGDLWVGEYALPGETAWTYTITDAAGRAIGRVTLPPRTSPLDVGPDYVLGLTRDELDVQRLTLWRLTRP